MNTPLSSFTALVKFQFDRDGLTTEISKVRNQLQSLAGVQQRQARNQESSSRQREQSAARTFVSEMRMQRLHTRALRENEAFDRIRQNDLEGRHRRREIAEQKATRDAQAKRLRELRLQDRAAAQQLRTDNIRRRAEAAEQTRLNNWLAQRERQERAAVEAQRKRDRDRQAQQLRAARATREQSRVEQKRLDDWHRRQEKVAQKLERDATARRIRELRSQGAATRLQAAREAATRRTQQRADTLEQARYNQWFQQRERDERNAQNSAERRRRNELQAQERANRLTQRNLRERASDERRSSAEQLRNLRRVEAERLRNVRRNPPQNTTRPPQGGNTNPWHIGTMAGGLGGLISRGNLAAVGAGAFTQQSFTQANFDIAQAPQFEFLTGSAEEAAKQVAFLNKEVDRLSLPLRETSNMYRQLLASTKKGLGIEKTQELFSSFSEISTMLGLSSDAQSRGLRAFAQMTSKGQVMS